MRADDGGVSNDFSFLTGGGEVGALIRARDWSTSPLGRPATWPQSLRTVVGLMLTSKFPMFVAWGPELGLIYNDPYAEILGSKHPAALGSRFRDVWSEIWSDISPLIDRALAGEATFHESLPLLMRRKGYDEQTWFTFSYSPVRDESGAVAGMYCACTETTAQMLAEGRQVAENERLRRLFDQAPGFMAVLRGPEHVFELTNAAYLQLVGGRDIVGKPIREALPDIEGQGFYELLDRVYATGEPFVGHGMPVRLRGRPDDPAEERFVDFVFQPITDANGRVSGIFVEGSDVTEAKRAEAALRESEARFRLIADSAPVPMWVSAPGGKREFVNQAYCRFLGVPYEAALTFDWRGALHPDDLPRILAEHIAGERSARPFTLEARYRRGDGEWRWLRSESQPRWGAGGEHAGFIGAAYDVTAARQAEADLRRINELLEERVAAALAEKEEAEERLRQAQKMEAVGQLTGGVAHDFNNLLTSVLGNLELLEMRLPDEKLRRLVQAASRSAQRGAKLTEQLLAFSRRQHLAPRPIDLNAAVSGMIEMLRRTLGGTVEVRAALADGLWPALVDATQIEVAALNLVINARDAMPLGGTVLIETRNARIGGRDAAGGRGRMDDPRVDDPRVDDPRVDDLRAGDYVVLSVKDTGEGMTPEILARAFEPFFTTKEVGKGTGLGLSQVYGLARQSGGTVRIASRLREGTTVEIYLPRAAAADAEPRSGDRADGPGRPRGTVLVVDDQDDVREVAGAYLETLGYRIVQAANGHAALDILREGGVDLLLVDHAMPGMSGVEVVRAARQARPGLPVVLMTGYADIDTLGGRLEGVALLKKPFRMQELAAALDAAPQPRRDAGGELAPLDELNR